MLKFFNTESNESSNQNFPVLESCLLGELAHRTVNDLSCASAALRLARRRSPGQDQGPLLDQLALRLEAPGAIQRLMQPPGHNKPLNLATQLEMLCQAMVVARYADQNIELKLSADDVELEAGAAWRMLMVIAELLVNAARHAFDVKGGTVYIGILVKAEAVVCRIRDNGGGWLGPSSRAGYGSRVVRMLVRDLSGKLNTTSSSRGTLIELSIPRVKGAPVAAFGVDRFN